MAQTAIIDGVPEKGFVPVSMNWVTRDTPFGPPVCRVKISNTGQLHAYYGLEVAQELNLNLDTVDDTMLDFNKIKYVKINLNGEDYAVPAYAFKK